MTEPVVPTPAAVDSLDEPRLSEESGVSLAIARLAAPVLRDLGFRLVRVRLSGQDGQTLQIMAERPDGTMDVEGCETITDALSPVLDVEDPIKGEYRLEISSPGIDRPLMRVSDFRRAIGFEAKVEMAVPLDGRKRFRGRIDALDENDGAPTIVLTRFDAKPGEPEVVTLNLSDVEDGRLVLTEDLVRESLRAAKRAAQEAGLPEAEDAGAEAAEAEAMPARGPGRFAARNAARQTKSQATPRPLVPAGLRAGPSRSTGPGAKPRRP